MNLRSNIFWLLDWLRGSPVKVHYNEIKSSISVANEKALEKILEHAVLTTKFYSKFALNSLTNFPVINKLVIKNEIDSFISSDFKKENLYRAVTSGSTGTPFVVYHDKNKKRRNTADTLVFAEKAGFKLGEPLFYFKIWNEVNKKNTILSKVENVIPVNVLDLSDSFISNWIKNANRLKGRFHFIGYTSAFEAIISYLRRNKKSTTLNVESLITMSETLTESTKASMKEVFGVDAVSRYSNVENGIIAQQKKQSSHFEINQASYCVEVLQLNKDLPAAEGTLGRIVITDLFNYGMPIIRYDTGDLGVKNENGFLSRIEGRKMDQIFNVNGDLISSFTITNQMWKYPEVIQYQFIQNSQKEYTFKLNVDQHFKKRDKLVEEFKMYLGEEALIRVEFVNEIPLLSSGKRRKVVQEFYK